MKGTIRRRGDAWTIQVYAGRRADGRRRYATRTVRAPDTRTGRRQAEDALAALITEVRSARPIGTDRLTVADLLERWLATGRPDWSPKAYATNRQQARTHVAPHVGAIPLDRLTPADVDGLYVTLRAQLAASTVARIHTSVLHPALERAVRWRLIATNPAHGADLPALDDDEVQVPPVEVVRALIDGARPPLAAYLHTAASIGARRGSLCGLRWETVDLDGGRARFERAMVIGDQGLAEKANKGRRAFAAELEPALVARLRAHRTWSLERAMATGARLGDRSFVWSPEPDGSVPWRPDNVSREFRRLRERLGIDGVRLHHVKHFAVSRMLAAGISAEIVAQRTGTTPATIRRVYAHWIPGADAPAAEVMERLLG